MRIVMLGTRGFPNVPGGVEKHCEHLAAGLVRLGCEVIVFTRKPYVDPAITEYQGVKLVALPALRHKSLEAFLHTFLGVFAARRFRPDVLHIQAIGPGLFVPLARALGMKVVLTTHGSNYKHLKWGRFAKLILRFGEFLGVRFSNRVIAISPMIAEEIKEKYDKNPEVIPNGVVIAAPVKTDEALRRYSLEKGKYILGVGRFVPEKGFHDLLEAFSRLSNSDKDFLNSGWKLVIAGDADHEDKYSAELKDKASKNKRVVLTGYLKEAPLRELYTYAGLFVLPSYYEGLPIALLEATSYGLSCLASDIPANRYLKLSEDRLYRAGDIQTMADKIKELVKRPLTPEEKEKTLRILREEYDWQKVAEKTLEVYKKAAY